MSINTLDVDFNDKEKLDYVLQRIGNYSREHKCLIDWKMEISPSWNGYHVTLTCKREGCELCRLVFDDPLRFSLDSERPAYARNMFFTDKKKLKAGTLQEIIEQLEDDICR